MDNEILNKRGRGRPSKGERVSTYVRIPLEQYAVIERLAEREHMSINAYCVKILVKHAEKKERLLKILED